MVFNQNNKNEQKTREELLANLIKEHCEKNGINFMMLSKITRLEYDYAKTILEMFSLDLAFCEFRNAAEDLGMRNYNLRYNRIRDTLAMKCKTVRELAEVLDVNPKTVYKWCSNKRQPRINELYAIAAFLYVDPCELLN